MSSLWHAWFSLKLFKSQLIFTKLQKTLNPKPRKLHMQSSCVWFQSTSSQTTAISHVYLQLYSDSWWQSNNLVSTCASNVAALHRSPLLQLGERDQNLNTTFTGSASNFIPTIGRHISTQHSNICDGSSFEIFEVDTIWFHAECISIFGVSRRWG